VRGGGSAIGSLIFRAALDSGSRGDTLLGCRVVDPRDVCTAVGGLHLEVADVCGVFAKVDDTWHSGHGVSDEEGGKSDVYEVEKLHYADRSTTFVAMSSGVIPDEENGCWMRSIYISFGNLLETHD